MSNYNILHLGRKAEQLGFIRDTLEKVVRLADILEYFNTNPILKENLALKGGTAINLTIFNLPPLSVDITLDYLKSDSRDEMFRKREVINSIIHKCKGFNVFSKLYSKSPRTKSQHSLDSWI